MVRSEGNMSLTNPVTPPGIDPGTVRLVAQRLNHYATPGPFGIQKDVKFDTGPISSKYTTFCSNRAYKSMTNSVTVN